MLLQNREKAANWGKIYNKLEQVLEFKSIFTNWDITSRNRC